MASMKRSHGGNKRAWAIEVREDFHFFHLCSSSPLVVPGRVKSTALFQRGQKLLYWAVSQEFCVGIYLGPWLEDKLSFMGAGMWQR